MKSHSAFLLAPLALCLLASGCSTLRNTPEVDVVPVKPVSYGQAPVVPVAAVARPATGSLFQQASYRPAFEDPRARMPGDTLTIHISEKITASQTSSANIDRSGDISGAISALPFLKPSALTRTGVGANSSNTFSGTGDTASANTFSGSITTTVLEVLPNGHLLVAGEKQIGVNQNVDVLRFSGTVDPKQIQPGNVVASTQVANARIESRGRGAQGEALAMGWLGRFFLSVMPF